MTRATFRELWSFIRLVFLELFRRKGQTSDANDDHKGSPLGFPYGGPIINTPA